MWFDILTIFPAFFDSPLQEGIVRRAMADGQISIAAHNIRDFAVDKHQMTDDRPFGGGEGMVMKPEPLAACLKALGNRPAASRVILLSPKGERFNQQAAQRLAEFEQLIFICGHYEGFDARIKEYLADEALSIGDFRCIITYSQ